MTRQETTERVDVGREHRQQFRDVLLQDALLVKLGYQVARMPVATPVVKLNSTHADDVRSALEAGFAAATILSGGTRRAESGELRIQPGRRR